MALYLHRIRCGRDPMKGGRHPAVCMLWGIAVFAATLLFRHPACLAVSLAGAVLYGSCVSVSGRKIAGILLIGSLIALLNPLFGENGSTPLFYLPWGSAYTAEALFYGMMAGLMFSACVLWFLCWNEAGGREILRYTLAETAPATSMVLNLIFRLLPELDRRRKNIAGARAAIGLACAEKTGEKARESSLILSSLLSDALERSVSTADSMKCRGYGSGKRSRYTEYRFRKEDVIFTVLLAVLCLILAAGLVSGAAYIEIYPQIVSAPAGKLVLFLPADVLLMAGPAINHQKEAFLWHYCRSKI